MADRNTLPLRVVLDTSTAQAQIAALREEVRRALSGAPGVSGAPGGGGGGDGLLAAAAGAGGTALAVQNRNIARQTQETIRISAARERLAKSTDRLARAERGVEKARRRLERVSVDGRADQVIAATGLTRYADALLREEAATKKLTRRQQQHVKLREDLGAATQREIDQGRRVVGQKRDEARARDRNAIAVEKESRARRNALLAGAARGGALLRGGVGAGAVAGGVVGIGLTAGAGLAAVVGLTALTVAGVRASDTIVRLRSQLRLVSNDAVGTERTLRDLAIRTRSGFESVVTIFARTSRALQSLDPTISQERILGFTESISQLVRISGSQAREAAGALIQLSQGLASNRLGGEELRSVMEQIPAVAIAIARGMGITLGELREISREGRLEAIPVIQAIEAEAERTAQQFETITPLVSDMNKLLGDSLVRLSGNLAIVTGMRDRWIEITETTRDFFNRQAERVEPPSREAVIERQVRDLERAGEYDALSTIFQPRPVAEVEKDLKRVTRVVEDARTEYERVRSLAGRNLYEIIETNGFNRESFRIWNDAEELLRQRRHTLQQAEFGQKRLNDELQRSIRFEETLGFEQKETSRAMRDRHRAERAGLALREQEVKIAGDQGYVERELEKIAVERGRIAGEAAAAEIRFPVPGTDQTRELSENERDFVVAVYENAARREYRVRQRTEAQRQRLEEESVTNTARIRAKGAERELAETRARGEGRLELLAAQQRTQELELRRQQRAELEALRENTAEQAKVEEAHLAERNAQAATFALDRALLEKRLAEEAERDRKSRADAEASALERGRRGLLALDRQSPLSQGEVTKTAEALGRAQERLARIADIWRRTRDDFEEAAAAQRAAGFIQADEARSQAEIRTHRNLANQLKEIYRDAWQEIGQSFASTIRGWEGGWRSWTAFILGELPRIVSAFHEVSLAAASIRAGGGRTFFDRAGSFFSRIFRFGGGRAYGGPVSAGRSYLVGERGPELFVPSGSGSIVPGGGVTINFPTLDVSADVQAQIAASVPYLAAAVTQQLQGARLE